MKNVTLLFGAMVLISVTRVGTAFWSDPYLIGTHQAITQSALSAPNAYCFSAGNCFPFSTNAVTQINKRHWIQDKAQNYYPNNHFDSNYLAGGVQQLANNRGTLNALLKNSPGPSIQPVLWALMGNMLHAVEDFYSHSTWVDEGNTVPLPTGFGALTQNPFSPIIPPSFAGSFQAAYCPSPAGYPTTLSPVNYLITGYYFEPLFQIATPPGGCVHGSTGSLIGTCAEALVAPNFVSITVPGISHDIPCPGNFSPANTMANHLMAYQLAIQEVQNFASSIVTDLVASKNAAGFCALLDLPSGTSMCAGPFSLDPASVSVSLTLLDLGPGVGSIVSGPGSVNQSCSSPCGFTSAGGSFNSTAVVTDSWTQYAAPNITLSSSLQGSVTFAASPNPMFNATANWSAIAGPFQGNFSGKFNFTTSQPYSVFVTPGCTGSIGAVGIPCGGSLPAINISSSLGVIQPQAPNQYTLAAGTYTFGWGLVGGTDASCCIGAPDNGSGPTATATVTLSASFQPIVAVGPAVTLTANPTSVTSGNSSTLTWNSPGAVSCSAPWTTSTATSGTASTGPLTKDTTYSMTCTDSSGATSAPASVTVPVTRVFDATFTYQGTIIGGSGSVQLGSGSFVYDTTSKNLSAFTLAITNQSTANPNVFNYGLGDVTSFSYNQVSGALNLTTNPVVGTNSIYFPQLFTVITQYGKNVGNTATQDFPSVPETSGPVTVTITN